MKSGWFNRNERQAPPRPRRFPDLQAMPAEHRHAALAGPEGPAWIEAAAQAGLVEAQVLVAQRLLDENRKHLALYWFQAAAAAGYTPAINMLGRCHEKGWAVPADPAMAAEHYRRAAEQRLDWAEYNLANLLLRGHGIARDRIHAFDLFTRAAAQGHAKSMNLLGRFHEEGWDRPRDPGLAAMWYRRAAEAGDYRGAFNYGTVLAQQGQIQQACKAIRNALATGNPDFQQEAVAILRASPDPALRALATRAITPTPPP
jgi:TPR repeat protein